VSHGSPVRTFGEMNASERLRAHLARPLPELPRGPVADTAMARALDALTGRAGEVADRALIDAIVDGEPIVEIDAATFRALRPREVPRFLASVATPDRRILVPVEVEGVQPVCGRADALLAEVNARYGADFDPDDFEPVAQAGAGFVDVRLRARRRVRVSAPVPEPALELAAGGELRATLGWRYTRTRLRHLAANAGLVLTAWLEEDGAALALLDAQKNLR
jgi:hypothetical protein